MFFVVVNFWGRSKEFTKQVASLEAAVADFNRYRSTRGVRAVSVSRSADLNSGIILQHG